MRLFHLWKTEKMLGKEHPDTLTSVYCVAYLLLQKKWYKDANFFFSIEHTLNIGRYSERSTRLLQHAHGNIQIGVFFFAESNACPLLFPSFYFCPFYFCPILLLLPLKHSIDTLRCHKTFDIFLSATGQSKRIPDDQPTPEDAPVKRAGIGIVVSASSTSLPYSITHSPPPTPAPADIPLRSAPLRFEYVA